MRARSLALVFALSIGCGEENAPVEAEASPVEAPLPEEREAVRLGVPAPMIHRARRDALGLARMSDGVRAQALERGREREATPAYPELREDAASHEGARVSYEGRVGLVRPAGPGLHILALSTRREGERWVDPLYVLSVVEPDVPEGALARVDGWIVGERTIGRHALPLVLAFHVERAGHR